MTSSFRAPKIFRVREEADLDRIPFEDGMAAVEVPAHLLDKLHLKNEARGDSARLQQLERSIRANGYRPVEPITARVGRKGRWVVVNGGHRLTAAKHIMREFWTNLFGPKVETFYFVLFLNPDSWEKVGVPDGVIVPQEPPDLRGDAQSAWVRAQDRMRQVRGNAS